MFPAALISRARRAVSLALVASLALVVPDALRAAAVPAGFTDSIIAGGLDAPTTMEIAPDGRIFVSEQTGALRVIKNGALLPAPFVTLSVNSLGERGLLGVAFDPDFASNRFVYVYYTTSSEPIHNRVSRFTASAADPDVAAPGETVLLDLDNLNATNHNGGALHFGADGKLYVSAGENAVGSNSQSLATVLGKILRINSDGSIPADNPFFGATFGNNRAIWAYGLRNPFTFAIQPGTGRILINDVGQSTWEEIDEGIAGANYGWPTAEGPVNCANAGFTCPIYVYDHSQGCSIAGGAFYNPAVPTFPASFAGKYFFAEYCGNWIKFIDPDAPPAAGDAPTFATGVSSPVDLRVGSDGSLYYLARGAGAVGRIQYTALAGSAYSRNYVQKVYVAYYGRPADPAGQDYWALRMDAAGQSLVAIIDAFGTSAEFTRRYGGLGFTQLVIGIYQQTLGRDPDQAGLAFYVGELQAGRRTIQSIAVDILNGATLPPDSIVVANKLDVAAYYTDKVGNGCAYGSEQDGVDILGGVTTDLATVIAAKAALDFRCGP